MAGASPAMTWGGQWVSVNAGCYHALPSKIIGKPFPAAVASP